MFNDIEFAASYIGTAHSVLQIFLLFSHLLYVDVIPSTLVYDFPI